MIPILIVWMVALAAGHLVTPQAREVLAETAARGVFPREGAAGRRALPNSPSGGYAPKAVDCPATRPVIRAASGLSEAETAWLKLRRPATVKPMTDFLTRAGIDGFDVAGFMSKASSDMSVLPNVAIAISGGGYRALMNGAGFLLAADERANSTKDKGGIGGLLQSATYMSGLSGGGWLVGSLFSNNFSTVADMRDQGKVWGFDRSILQGPDSSRSKLKSAFKTADYWTDLAKQVEAKEDAGFEVSLTDVWGRMLAYQLIDADAGGAAFTFSSIALTDGFKKGQTPMPIIAAVGRAPSTRIIALNSTNFEFTPFEMGSWDPTAYGFAPTEYLASDFRGGVIPPDGKCVRGFDSSSFIMGASSSLFNMVLLTNLTEAAPGVPQFVRDLVLKIAESVDRDNNDIADFTPNPFLGYHNTTAGGIATSQKLALVDGGEDEQNLPLQPLIAPARRVDVVFAVENSGDSKTNWPDGTSLRATYERSLGKMANGTRFPAVPDAATFLNNGLNNRPTFFGCDAANFSGAAAGSVPPLIVWLPNAPYTYMSNLSTFTMTYPIEQRNDMILNGFHSATQGNGTLDKDWSACVACAVLQRSLLRTKTAMPPKCDACFKRYCWDGKLNSTAPRAYEPSYKIADMTTDPSSSSSAAAGLVATCGRSLVLAFSLVAAAASATIFL